MDAKIVVNQVRKKFNALPVVDGVDFSIADG